MRCSFSLSSIRPFALWAAFVVSFAVGGFGLSATPADAGIKCNGPNQLIKGLGMKPSPFCEAEYVARVARTYGVRVTGATLRGNINRFTKVCQFIGNDSRVSHICASYRRNDGGRRWNG